MAFANLHVETLDLVYNYVPTEYVAIIFIVLYGLSTAFHVGQAVYYRIWWLFITVILAGVAEILGWSSRLWSSFSPDLLTPYEIQYVGFIISLKHAGLSFWKNQTHYYHHCTDATRSRQFCNPRPSHPATRT